MDVVMIEEVVNEILIDLILEEVMGDGKLFEFNPYHDASGQFTSKGASAAYGSGAMAAGRAAGMRAKALGMSREDVRTAIKAGMQTQMLKAQTGAGRTASTEGYHTSDYRTTAKGELERARAEAKAIKQAAMEAPKENEARKAFNAAKSVSVPESMNTMAELYAAYNERRSLGQQRSEYVSMERRALYGKQDSWLQRERLSHAREQIARYDKQIEALDTKIRDNEKRAKGKDLSHPEKGNFSRSTSERRPFSGHESTFEVAGKPEAGKVTFQSPRYQDKYYTLSWAHPSEKGSWTRASTSHSELSTMAKNLFGISV